MIEKINISKLKSYHIIFLGCILGIILVLNSNHINDIKLKNKQKNKEEALFNKIISLRKLQGDAPVVPPQNPEEEEDEEITETQAVCLHSSDDLQKYYKTGDLSEIGLDEGAIKCEDKESDYMKALIEIVKKLIEGDSSEHNDETVSNGRRLRNLIDSETEENIKIYGSRILPLLIFFCFSILSLVGWIVCCFCNCCNCCCCCCCKKPGCKIPCLVINYIFYALAVAVCIYGLTQTKKTFTGISNTECSFLQFFDVILFGEEKEEMPKWIGIEGVSNILTGLNNEITNMKNAHLEDELDLHMEAITEQRDNFLPKLKSVHKHFYKDGDDSSIGNVKDGYYIEYTAADNKYIKQEGHDVKLEGKYVLDLVKMFGVYDDSKKDEENEGFNGTNSIWNIEISAIDRNAGDAMEEAKDSFQSMLGENLDKIEEGLSQGSEKLDKLRKPFYNVYDEISGSMYKISEYMNDYGEISVKYVFGALALLNLLLAILLLLICCFSGQSCANGCCCCRCLCKLWLHLIWNLLALFMIISFMIGSVLALIGKVGSDVMTLVSFIVSEENFNDVKPVLLDKLDKGKDILKECIVGEGNLSSVFELDGLTGDFDTIYSVKDDIVSYKERFNSLARGYPAYHVLRGFLENRTEFREETNFIRMDTENLGTAPNLISPGFKLSDLISSLNDAIGSTKDEKWDQNIGDRNFVCDEDNTGSGPAGSPIGNKLHPWACQPIYLGWVKNGDSSYSSADFSKIQNYAQITSDAIDILKYANNSKTLNGDYESYFAILEDLKNDYTDYLDQFVEVLDFFDTITSNIIDTLKEGIGNNNNNDTFAFLNGKFIKTNLKIILKYLKYSLGKDIYTVGLCLVIVGFALIFSISLTILVNVIIGFDLEKNKKLASDSTETPNFQVNNGGRIVKFDY